LCEDAFVLAEQERDPLVSASRLAHDRITDLFGQCDIVLSTLVSDRFPDGPSWDAAFFDWLGVEFEKLLRTRRKELKKLRG
jgi:hypothetical protein